MSAVSIRPSTVSIGADRTSSTTLQAEMADSDVFRKKNGRILMATAPTTGQSVKPQLRHSFLSSLYMAYSDHYRLEIRPDDVWLTIMLSFADYVDNHAETLRKIFVRHDGKVQLLVDCGTASFQTVDWSWVMGKFSDMINQNTNDGVRDWAEPRFSTTTPTDSLIARVALMGALKSYFAYGCYTRCGFPEIIIKGTPADWMLLSSKLSKFQEIGSLTGLRDLTSWYVLLNRVVGKFASAVTTGEVDKNFWMSAIDRSRGSGADTISGWSLAFAPFKKGCWNLRDIDSIDRDSWHFGDVETSELVNVRSVEVPVKFNDAGKMHDVYLCAGAYVASFETATSTIRPSFDFALVEVPVGTIKDVFDWRDPRVKPIRTEEISGFTVAPRTSTNAVRPSNRDPLIATPELVEQMLAAARRQTPGNTGGLRPLTYTYPHEPAAVAQPRQPTTAVTAPLRPIPTYPPTADLRNLHLHTLSYTIFGLTQRAQCNVCMQLGISSSYRCVGCDYDVCMTCFNRHHNVQPITINPRIVGNPANPPGPAPGYDVYGLPRVQPATSVTIPSCHQHALVRLMFQNGHTCDLCGHSPVMTGYRCPDCDFDVCLGCMARQFTA